MIVTATALAAITGILIFIAITTGLTTIQHLVGTTAVGMFTPHTITTLITINLIIRDML